jgi:hypothetical protein
MPRLKNHSVGTSSPNGQFNLFEPRVQNPNAPYLSVDRAALAARASRSRDYDVVARHRAAARVGLEDRQRAIFVEQATADPNGLFDRYRSKRRYQGFGERLAADSDLSSSSIVNVVSHIPDHVELHGTTEPTGVGEMWWGVSNQFTPGWLGISGIWINAGLTMVGQLNWDSGDLLQTSFRVVSSFYLGPERMPSAVRVRSAPGGVLMGGLFGYTSGTPIFGVFDGDQWSKCDLRLAQHAWAINPSNPNDVIPAAPDGNTQTRIVNVDEAFGYQEGSLPGGLAYPPIEIVLDRTRILRIDLDLELFFQLEGEAGIRFGGIGHADPAFHQWTQWTVQSL